MVSLLIKLQASACNFVKKETLAQVFSCKFCEIFKKFFDRAPLGAVSVFIISFFKNRQQKMHAPNQTATMHYVKIRTTASGIMNNNILKEPTFIEKSQL